MRTALSMLGGLAFVLYLTCKGLGAAQQPLAFSPEDYFAVVEALFRSEPRSDDPEIRLQYLFDRSGESQIVVRTRSGEDFDVETWRLPEGSRPIESQFEDFAAEQPKPSIESIVNRIVFRRRSYLVELRSPLGQLIAQGFSLKLPLVRRTRAFLDAATFRIEVRSLATRLSIEMNAPATNNAEDVVVRWMERMRTEVRRLDAK